MSSFLGYEEDVHEAFSTGEDSCGTGGSGDGGSALPEGSTASSNPNGSTHDHNTGGQSGRPGSIADSMASDSSAGTVVANQASGKQPRDEMLGATDAQGFTEVSITF